MKRFFFVLTGIIFIGVGIIGWLIPVVPGWPLLIVGLSMLAPSAFFQFKYRLQQRLHKRDVIYFSEWKKNGVDAAVTTKHLPVLLKKTSELGDAENRKKFCDALALSSVTAANKLVFEGKFVYLNQVHGARVAALDSWEDYRNPGFYVLPQTDGVITNIPGLTLLVMTADCLSIFLRAPGWVGVVHAGWRGTQQEIIKNAAVLISQKSKSALSDVHLIFGPSICGRHYEVGQEFKNYFKAPALKSKNGKLYFDLVAENRRQIMSLGVPKKNISISSHCTVSENEHFYSFRVEKESAGRIISFIQLCAEGFNPTAGPRH